VTYTQDELLAGLIKTLIDWRWEILLAEPSKVTLQISMTPQSCANFAGELIAKLDAAKDARKERGE
jgi:hypothetical protein